MKNSDHFRKVFYHLLPKWISILGCTFVCLCLLTTIVRKSNNWDGVFLNKIILFAKYQPAEDLKPFSHSYELVLNDEKPDNIVLIIGESLSKRRMSAYGYEHETTPLLSQRISDSSVVAFSNVSASAVRTTEAFKYLMTGINSDDDIDSWKSHPFLIDIVKSAGYHTSWISNQSSSGFYDNIVARFAELSDTLIWCGQQHVGLYKHDYDGITIPEIESIKSKSNGNAFTIVHLMGSHEDFRLRYPEDYAKFDESDYNDKPEIQRITSAAYDNSVLYNDYVVDSIIQLFKNDEAIVIYLSDHALDLYASSDDFVGHSRLNDEVSVAAGLDIPFIVYTSPQFNEKFPDLTNRIKRTKDVEFNSEDLFYSIMDIIGAEFPNSTDVSTHSLFRK